MNYDEIKKFSTDIKINTFYMDCYKNFSGIYPFITLSFIREDGKYKDEIRFIHIPDANKNLDIVTKIKDNLNKIIGSNLLRIELLSTSTTNGNILSEIPIKLVTIGDNIFALGNMKETAFIRILDRKLSQSFFNKQEILEQAEDFIKNKFNTIFNECSNIIKDFSQLVNINQQYITKLSSDESNELVTYLEKIDILLSKT